MPQQHTGSSLFYAVLKDVAAQFPDVLAAADLGDQPNAWKRTYGSALARFEARRIASPQRAEIAHFMLRRAQSALLFADGGGQPQPLADYMAGDEPAPALQRHVGSGEPKLRVEVPIDGKVYRGREVLALADRLADEAEITEAARLALRWIVEHIETSGGVLDLRGQRFAILGAGAELAATALLLDAGASVLWVDLADPARWLGRHGTCPGTVVHAERARNLLEEPRSIRAAIEAFAAEGGPVDLGLFAYASGASQEWRLGAAMNAIAAHLEPSALRSVAMLVSPTTVPTLQPESLRAAARQLSVEPMWKLALHRAGLLPKPGHLSLGGANVGLSTVSVQGLSYQAAQYVSKLAAAESFAIYGPAWSNGAARPITVSANVAGITKTRSLSHPLFEAAFIGAPRFGVRIFEPETTRALSGLLILHDLLNAEGPGSATRTLEPAAKAGAVLSQQVHGGIYNLPYPLEHAIRVAAVIGMGRRPSVLLRRNGKGSEVRA